MRHGREPARIRLAQRLERDLGVHVGAVLGEDRQDELARRIEPALPDRSPVQALELVQREPRKPGPVSLEPLRVARARVGELALPRPALLRRRCARRGHHVDTSLASRSPQRSSGAAPAAIAFLDRHRPLDDRHRRRADVRQRTDAVDLHPATDRDARHAGRDAPFRDAERGLPEGGLGVDPPLAGDDEVGSREACREVGRLHHEVDPRPQGERSEPTLRRKEGKPDPASRAGTRRVAFVTALAGLQLVGPGRIPRVECLDVLRGGALLRSVRRRRAGRPQERVGYIAGDLHVGRVGPVLAIGQALEQSAPPVGRGAPADPERDVPRSGVDRRTDELAGPDGRRRDRITVRGRYQR